MLAACRRLLQPAGGAGWLRRFSSLPESGERVIKAAGACNAATRACVAEEATLGRAAGNVGSWRLVVDASIACPSRREQRIAAQPCRQRRRRHEAPLPYRHFDRPCLPPPWMHAAIHETPFGEFIPLSDQAGVPVLVRLHERQWGALARLPAAKLTEAGYEGAWGREDSSMAWHGEVAWGRLIAGCVLVCRSAILCASPQTDRMPHPPAMHANA